MGEGRREKVSVSCGAIRWDVCPFFHGFNDFAYNSSGSDARYSRCQTYGGECYAEQDGEERCRRRGRCVVARGTFVSASRRGRDEGREP